MVDWLMGQAVFIGVSPMFPQSHVALAHEDQ